MKVTNIVLSILILLLSVAAAVFSYFLFEKRMKVDEILDLIRERRPDLEMDVAAPSRMLDR